MRIFISGGAKNGKSHHAQCLAKAQAKDKLYYIATMTPQDDEDRERIRRHVRDRAGWGFETIEQSHDIAKILPGCDPSASFLLDSVTALLANEMFGPNGKIDRLAPAKVAQDLILLLEKTENIVFVSDYIFSDSLPYDDFTESYRKGLALIDRAVARQCDIVAEAVCGRIMVHKGGALFDPLALKAALPLPRRTNSQEAVI